MSSYSYVAVDPRGGESRGTLEVVDQNEAVRRIKEMGLFPTRVLAEPSRKLRFSRARYGETGDGRWHPFFKMEFGSKVKPAQLAILTRQLATLIDAGMPLLRSLRVLSEQAESRALRRI